MAQKRRKYRVVLILLGALGLLFAVTAASLIYLYTTPIDLSRYSKEISARIEAKTGVRFSAEKIVVQTLPSLEVRLENVDFFENSETFLIVPKITATFSLLKILTGNMEPRILDITEPDILVKRYSDGTPNLGARFLAGIRPTGTLKKLALHNGRSTIVDESIKGGPQKFALTDVEIAFDKGRDTEFTASFTANLDSTPIKILSTGGYKDNRLHFSGPVTFGTFDLNRLTPYIEQKAPKGAIKGSATAKLNLAFDRGLTIEGGLKYKELSIKIPKLFNKKVESKGGTAKLKLVIDANEVRAGLSGIEFKMADFVLNGGFEVLAPHSAGAKGRELKLKLSTTPIKFKRFVSLLPPNLLSGSLEQRIGGLRPLGGTVTVEELLVNGRFDNLNNLGALAKDGKVSLKLKLDKLKFTGKVIKETFSGIKGNVSLENNRLILKDFSGNYGQGVLKTLNAEITELSTEPKYNLSATAFFEAGKTLEVLKALLSAKGNKNATRLKGITASGITELNLNLKGIVKDLTPTYFSGIIRLKNSNFGHKAFLLKLSALNGEITFDTDTLTFNKLSGVAWQSRFKVNGTVKEYLKNPQIDITAEGRLANETVQALAGDTALKDLRLGTNVPFNISVKGNGNRLDSHAKIDITGSTLKYKTLIDKSAGYPLAMKVDLIKIEDDKVSELRIKEIQITTGTSRAGITGVYNLNDDSYTLNASTSEFRVSDIAGLSPVIDAAGSTDGSIGLSFKATRDSAKAAPIYKGVATVQNAAFTSGYIPRPVERLDMTAKYGPGGRLLDIKKLVAGRNDLKGRVEFTPMPASLKSKKRLWNIDFDLEAKGLFLDDLLGTKKSGDIAAGDKESSAEVKESKSTGLRLKSIHSGRGKLHISKGSIRGFHFEELSTEISIDPERIYSKEIRLKKNRGSIASSVTYYRTDSSPLLFDSTTVISGIDLKQFIEELGAKKTIIEGEVSIDLTLKGLRGVTPVTAGLTGKANMKVGQGKLWKFIAMSKLLSIINIFSIDELLQPGLPYKRITGDFDIKEGVVRSNNIYLESDTLRMTAMGEISIPARYIDSVLMLHPFVTIDKIVTNIPLVGWIIGGKEKSAASMYYEIVGPLKKPYIDPVPVKSISVGVKEMLERLGGQLEGSGGKKSSGKQPAQ